MGDIPNFSNYTNYLSWIILVGLVLFFIRLISRRPTKAETIPQNAIVVDGSNVMHWGGDPSAKVLRRVIDHLKNKGLSPYVIFDANVGYKLQDRYMDDAPMARLLGLPVAQVLVVQKGQIADEIILQFAQAGGHRIVSNDRFRDWSVQYNFVKTKGRMVRGTFREGALRISSL